MNRRAVSSGSTKIVEPLQPMAVTDERLSPCQPLADFENVSEHTLAERPRLRMLGQFRRGCFEGVLANTVDRIR